VIDFGYSTILRNSNKIDLPFSNGWTAPEYDEHRGFEYQHALNMDAYSFCLLCLWFLRFSNQGCVPQRYVDELPLCLEPLIKDLVVDNPNIENVLKRALKREPTERDVSLAEIAEVFRPEQKK